MTPEYQGSVAVEEQVERWRDYLRRRQAIHSVDVVELEDHLREEMARLTAAGLAPDEAFLVAVKRMGDLDSLSREFAREHSERLWKQLVVAPTDAGAPETAARTDAVVAFALAIAAAVLVKLPSLFGITVDTHEAFYARNAALFVLPLLAGFLAWKHGASASTTRWIAVAFATAVVVVNVYPFASSANTLALAALHLPIALWLPVGLAYAGGQWREHARRMDFIRFSGELFIYFVLLALGGGLLLAFMAGIFGAIGMNIESFVGSWLMPSAPAGAFIVAAWLVGAKQSVIENMAPVLTRLFTPFFALVLLVFLVTLAVTGRGIDVERNALIIFDLLLVVVLALMLYSLSARDPQAPPGLFDVVQVVLIVSALVADAFALSAIAGRITEFGFTPNRLAALGMNVVLLVNLAWSAVLYIRFLRRHGSFAALERWQTGYLPVYAAWAAIVVIVFPPLFRFI